MEKSRVVVEIEKLKQEKSDVEKRLKEKKREKKDVSDLVEYLNAIKFDIYVYQGILFGEQKTSKDDKDIYWERDDVKDGQIVNPNDSSEILFDLFQSGPAIDTNILVFHILLETITTFYEYCIISNKKLGSSYTRLKDLGIGFPESFSSKKTFKSYIRKIESQPKYRYNQHQKKIRDYLISCLPCESYLLALAPGTRNNYVKKDLYEKWNRDYSWVMQDDLEIEDDPSFELEEQPMLSFVDCCNSQNLNPNIVRNTYKKILKMDLDELINGLNNLRVVPKKDKEETLDENQDQQVMYS